jgi:hypothetical protein
VSKTAPDLVAELHQVLDTAWDAELEPFQYAGRSVPCGGCTTSASTAGPPRRAAVPAGGVASGVTASAARSVDVQAPSGAGTWPGAIGARTSWRAQPAVAILRCADKEDFSRDLSALRTA